MWSLVLSTFALLLGTEPLAVDRSLAEHRLKTLDRVVAGRKPEWALDAERTTPQGVKREWIRKRPDATQGEPARVVVSLVSFASVEKAKDRLRQARMDTSLSPVQGEIPTGDGCIVWKGYVDPERRLFHCTTGTVFFSMIAPSEDIGRQFAADIAEGLKETMEKM